MLLTIKTPEKNIFNGTVQSIDIPGKKDPFQILNNHAPIISTLISKGIIKYKDDKGKEHTMITEGGLIEANNNQIVILLYK